MTDRSASHPRERVEGRLKVIGQVLYTGDTTPDGPLYAVALQSMIAKSRIEEIATRAAELMLGVVAVITYRNEYTRFADHTRQADLSALRLMHLTYSENYV